MYYCTVDGCQFATPRLWKLQRHAIYHEKSKGPNRCSLCPYRSERVFNVLRHQRVKHKGEACRVIYEEGESTVQMAEPIEENEVTIVGMVDDEAEKVVEEEKPQMLDMGNVVDEEKPEEATPQMLNMGKVEKEKEKEDEDEHLLILPKRIVSIEEAFPYKMVDHQKAKFFERLGRSNTDVCLYELYFNVIKRGGFWKVNNWDAVAIAICKPNYDAYALAALYVKELLPFEDEDFPRLERLVELGIPHWWDDGDSVAFKKYEILIRDHPFEPETVQNMLLEIYLKYYIPSVANDTTFHIKHSWLVIASMSATDMLNAMKIVK